MIRILRRPEVAALTGFVPIAARPRATDVRPDIGADPRRRGVGRRKRSRRTGSASGVQDSNP